MSLEAVFGRVCDNIASEILQNNLKKYVYRQIRLRYPKNYLSTFQKNIGKKLVHIQPNVKQT